MVRPLSGRHAPSSKELEETVLPTSLKQMYIQSQGLVGIKGGSCALAVRRTGWATRKRGTGTEVAALLGWSSRDTGFQVQVSAAIDRNLA